LIDDSPKQSSPTPLPEIEVDESNAEVMEIVSAAMKTAEQHPITLSTEVTVDLIEQAIKEVEDELALSNPDGAQ